MATRDDRLEQTVGRILQVGVLLAAAVVLLGAAIFLVRHGHQATALRVFRGEPADLRTFGGIAADVARGRGRGIIQLGLILLILTPTARVAFALAAFARERDRLYTGVALFVLAVLLYGLLGSGPR